MRIWDREEKRAASANASTNKTNANGNLYNRLIFKLTFLNRLRLIVIGDNAQSNGNDGKPTTKAAITAMRLSKQQQRARWACRSSYKDGTMRTKSHLLDIYGHFLSFDALSLLKGLTIGTGADHCQYQPISNQPVFVLFFVRSHSTLPSTMATTQEK